MNDQAKNLRIKIDKPTQEKKAKTISIVSGKGGVGKSNFALNFSLELINQGKKVLLLDLDVGMGNIDILCGLQAKQTIIDMLNQQLSIHDIVEKGPKDLSYIAGGSSVTNFFLMDESKMNYFSNQYNELVNEYDFIIFDMGAGATADSLFFILASDECIVMTTPEPTAITDAYSMIKHIVNKEANMPIYVIMNRCKSERSGKQALDRFKQVVMRFLHVKIEAIGKLPEDQIVSKAVIQQTPYILLDKKSNISRSLKQLTNNYLSNRTNTSTMRPFSFMQKLKHLMRER